MLSIAFQAVWAGKYKKKIKIKKLRLLGLVKEYLFWLFLGSVFEIVNTSPPGLAENP